MAARRVSASRASDTVAVAEQAAAGWAAAVRDERAAAGRDRVGHAARRAVVGVADERVAGAGALGRARGRAGAGHVGRDRLVAALEAVDAAVAAGRRAV